MREKGATTVKGVAASRGERLLLKWAWLPCKEKEKRAA